jgi:hypothetical protein
MHAEVDVVPYELVGRSRREGLEARHLPAGIVDHVHQKAKWIGHGVPVLPLEAIKVDRVAADPGWRAGLKPAQTEARVF